MLLRAWICPSKILNYYIFPGLKICLFLSSPRKDREQLLGIIMTPFKLCSLVVKIVSAILTPDGIYGGLDLCWRNEFQAIDRRKKVLGLEHIILVK